MNIILFYFLSLTWGLPQTLGGAIMALVLIITGHKPKMWKNCVWFEVDKNIGGFNLGLFFVTRRGASTHLKNHEYGHAIQNCILGPFMPLVVSLPSSVRYWYREFRYNRRGKTPPTPYESIWFEKWATNLGKKML